MNILTQKSHVLQLFDKKAKYILKCSIYQHVFYIFKYFFFFLRAKNKNEIQKIYPNYNVKNRYLNDPF